MTIHYHEFQLTLSAYRHGFHDEDFAEMLRGKHLVIRNRRGRQVGYEIFGRNAAGAYLLAACRVVKSSGQKVLRVFHLARMSDADRRRYERCVR